MESKAIIFVSDLPVAIFDTMDQAVDAVKLTYSKRSLRFSIKNSYIKEFVVFSQDDHDTEGVIREVNYYTEVETF